ncbi:MAG: serine/threonine protein kinase, partial [bacterium]
MSVAVPMLEIAQERLRGVGNLFTQRADKKISLPLSEVKISAKVAERVATVVLTQIFQNPYPDHLEAVYIFPLPGGAAVSDFEMKVGNRCIRGKVEERGQARLQYQQAIDDG